MIRFAMIALAIVFPDQLPIGLLDDGRLKGDFRLMHFMRQKVRLEVISNRRKVRRRRRETNPNVARDTRAVHRFQAVLRFIEVTAHVARRDQAAIVRVGPLMIRTYKSRRRAVRRRTDSRPAMPASIME